MAKADFDALVRVSNHSSLSILHQLRIFEASVTSWLMYGLHTARLKLCEFQKTGRFSDQVVTADPCHPAFLHQSRQCVVPPSSRHSCNFDSCCYLVVWQDCPMTIHRPPGVGARRGLLLVLCDSAPSPRSPPTTTFPPHPPPPPPTCLPLLQHTHRPYTALTAHMSSFPPRNKEAHPKDKK